MSAGRASVLATVLILIASTGCGPAATEEPCQPGDCPTGELCADGLCQVPPACAPDNCNGCCQGDVCLDGTEPSACGVAGLGCYICPTGAECTGGTCTVPCGPDTCDGCCSPTDGCLSGDEIGACGTGGMACFDCGDGECSSGQCIGAACAVECDGCCDGDTCIAVVADKACGKDGGACVVCRDGTDCTGGACIVDPESRWNLVLVNGEIPATTYNDESWDGFGGAPDPYLDLTLTLADDSQIHYVTAFVDDTLVPAWNETVLTSQPASVLLAEQGSEFTLDLYDDDVSYDDLIGSCFMTGFSNDAFGAIVTVTCPANPATMNSGWLLRFRLELAE